MVEPMDKRRFTGLWGAVAALVVAATSVLIGGAYWAYFAPRHPSLADALHDHDTADVARWLRRHPNALNQPLLPGGTGTPLYVALAEHDVETVRLLLRFGASTNVALPDGERVLALHVAIAEEFPEGVAAVLVAGADPDARSADGWTALHELHMPRSIGFEVMGRSDWFATSVRLHRDAAPRVIETARILISAGATVDARDHFGWTPAQRAAAVGAFDLADYLIERGARLDSRLSGVPVYAESGGTPVGRISDATLLHVAAARDAHPDLIAYLPQHRLDPEARATLEWADGRPPQEVRPVDLARLLGRQRSAEALSGP